MYVLYVIYVGVHLVYYIYCVQRYITAYHSSLYSSIGSILGRASINQLAASISSPSSYNIILKASVTRSRYSRLAL